MPVACLIAGTIKDKILKSEVKDELSTSKINNDEYSIDAERKMTVTLGLMSVYVVIGLIIGSIF